MKLQQKKRKINRVLFKYFRQTNLGFTYKFISQEILQQNEIKNTLVIQN